MISQLYIAIAISAVSVAIGFGAAWKIQNGLQAEGEVERVQQTLRTIQESAARDIRKIDNVVAAQNAATIRARVLRDDADSARRALVGVRDAATARVLAAQADHAACIDASIALNDVFQTVSTERRELSEKADRHVNDIQTLTDACTNGND